MQVHRFLDEAEFENSVTFAGEQENSNTPEKMNDSFNVNGSSCELNACGRKLKRPIK